MAKLMDMKEVKNNVHRNAFDLSHRNLFTSKVGELLPVLCKEVLPGDKWRINLNSMSRTCPVQTAAFTRIREYYDFYFVPTSLLWDKFNNFIVQTNNYNHAQSINLSPDNLTYHPYFTGENLRTYLHELDTDGIMNAASMRSAESTLKLLNYLGYGDLTKFATTPTGDFPQFFSNLAFNPFPLMAYQKIYYDYFRFDQWETNKPQAYNCDYIFTNSSTNMDVSKISFYSRPSGPKLQDDMFTMRYANYKKDLIMGVLRRPQFGDTSIATPLIGSQRLGFGNVNPADPSGDLKKGFVALAVSQTNNPLGNGLGVSVFALRLAEATQKWREITNSGDLDFKTQMQKHWNVSVSESDSYKCRWIGGTASNITINEVLNTNLDSENSQALIAGKGMGVSSDNNVVSFESKDYGYLLCIYHSEPLLDYHNNGISRMYFKTTAEDYAIPEFDSLGMVSLPLSELSVDFTQDADAIAKSIGYVPRYYDYKTSRDVVNGAFKTVLKDWVAPINGAALYDDILFSGMSYLNFKIHPSSLDSIFLPQASVDDSVDSDQIYNSVFFDINTVRNLSFSGLPY